MRKRLADLVADRVQRRERAHRLLEDDRDPVAADGAPLRAAGRHGGEVDRRRVAARIGEPDAAAPRSSRCAAGCPGSPARSRSCRSRSRRPAPRCGWAGRRTRRPCTACTSAPSAANDDLEVADRQQRRRHPASRNSAPIADEPRAGVILQNRQHAVQGQKAVIIHGQVVGEDADGLAGAPDGVPRSSRP